MSSMTQYDLIDACAEPGCPVCLLIDRQLDRYLKAVVYESVLDRGMRAKIAAAQGWCADHAPDWLAVANPLATADIYAAMLDAIVPGITASTANRRSLLGRKSDDISPIVPASAVCPACTYQEQAEREILATLYKALGDAVFIASFRASDGLCLPHLRIAFSSGISAQVADHLRERAQITITRLRHDLGLVIDHHDYRYTGPRSDGERVAPEQAVAWVSGMRKKR